MATKLIFPLNGTTQPLFVPQPEWILVLGFELMTCCIELLIVLWVLKAEKISWKKLFLSILLANIMSFVFGLFLWFAVFGSLGGI